MSAASFHDLLPLRTDADVLTRVEQIIGPATAPSTLWIFLVDGDGRQAPTVLPVEGVPVRPEVEDLAGVVGLVEQVVSVLATDEGGGAAFFALERTGGGDPTPGDRRWAEGLTAACAGAGVVSRGVHLVTAHGARRL